MRFVSSASVCIVFAAMGCNGFQNSISPAEQALNRSDFALFAAGAVFVADAVVVAECVPELSPTEAYPGLDASTIWGNITAFELRNITHSGPTASVPTVDKLLVLHDRAFDQGDELDDLFFSVARYNGPTAPGLNASIRCGDILVTPTNAVRKLYQTRAAFDHHYGVNTSEAVAAIVDEQEEANEIVATQESFLQPPAAAEVIVGDLDWPPPTLRPGA
jgi:hypothetical protein